MRWTCLCCAALLAGLASPLFSIQEGAKEGGSKAIVLGVGSPTISAERSGTSIGIAAGGRLYVFDAGAGVERRLLEARPQLQSLGIQRFGPVFITHLHLDHTLGLAALYRYHQFARDGTLVMGPAPLTVYGPAGLASMMDHIAGAFAPLDPAVRKAMTVTARELQGGETAYRDDQVAVRAIQVEHKDGPALAYRIETADRVVVISGDTRPVDALIEACDGCDVLFHEVFGVDFGPDGPPSSGPPAGHTSAVELGEVARRARPKLLVLYHTLGASPEDLIAGVKRSFSGPVVYARDLDVF